MLLWRHHKHRLRKATFQQLYESRCLKACSQCKSADLERLSSSSQTASGTLLDWDKLTRSLSISILPRIMTFLLAICQDWAHCWNLQKPLSSCPRLRELILSNRNAWWHAHPIFRWPSPLVLRTPQNFLRYKEWLNTDNESCNVPPSQVQIQ